MKKFLGGCLVLLLLLGALAYYWTTTWPEEVHRSIDIDAPAAAIYATVATPSTWPEWTAWTPERDPTVESTFDGPASGTGASWEWQGASMAEEGLGHGKLTLLETVPGERIDYGLVFYEEDTEWESTGAFTFEETAGTTTVQWSIQPAGVDGLMKRFAGMMMDMSVGPDFETGLGKLKQRLESGSLPIEAPTVPVEAPAENG